MFDTLMNITVSRETAKFLTCLPIFVMIFLDIYYIGRSLK